MTSKTIRWALATATLAVVAFVGGCGSSSGPGSSSVCSVCNGGTDAGSITIGNGVDSGYSQQTDSGGSNQGADSSGIQTDTDGGSTVGTADLACVSNPTSCAGCCQQNHPSGFTTLNGATSSCVCASSGPCASACSTEFCANMNAPTPGDACDTCLTTATNDSPPGACYTQVNTACSNDPDCNAYLTCVTQTGCNN